MYVTNLWISAEITLHPYFKVGRLDEVLVRGRQMFNVRHDRISHLLHTEQFCVYQW